jgi:energy-coupling factor transporter ATP-binding protein EcfA2
LAKRLATIRRGIRYQDLVAAEALVDMLTGGSQPPLSVRLEDRRGGAFDDVVVTYGDRVVWKQVKWAQHPGADPLTIDSLSSAKRGKKPAIRRFADSFVQVSGASDPCELELITNRSPDSEFRQLISSRTSRLKARLTKAQYDRLSSSWSTVAGLEDDQFKAFLAKLAFLVNSPDIERREKELRTQLRLLGCADTAFGQLLGAIWDWAQDESKDLLVRSDVEGVLGHGFDTPSNEFQLPTFRVERPEVQRELVRRIIALDSGYLVVLGSPGSGKSTLLNTLKDIEPEVQQDLIIYNCFTGTSDNFLRTRARADNYAKFLSRQFHERYSAAGLSIGSTAQDIEALLSRAAATLPDGRKLTLVIDGLDYARRFAPDGAESLIGNLPPKLPQHVVVVVSAQVSQQLPSHLQAVSRSSVVEVPPLDESAIDALLEKYGVYGASPLKAHERDDLRRKVQQITAGHALHVSYAARQLATAAREGINPLISVSALPSSHGDIDAYYRTLFAPPSLATAREALAILASCPFELSGAEVAAAMSPVANPRDIEDALRPFRYLFQQIGGHYYFSHDSLRVFADRELESGGMSIADQIAFLSKLQNDPRVGDHFLQLVAGANGDLAATEGIDCDWVARQIAAGASIRLLDEGLMTMALHALKRTSWAMAARWWSLQACLQRAELEGDLDEATLINVWLARKELALVERYIFISSQFLSKVYPGPDLLDLLEHHGHTELAERLRDRQLSQTPPPLDPSGLIDQFGDFVRHASQRMSVDELLPVLRKRVKEISEQRDVNGFPPLIDPAKRLADYVESIVRECFYANDLDRAEKWLDADPQLLPEPTFAELFLQLRLLRCNLDQHDELVKAAIEAVESLGLLAKLAALHGYDKDIVEAVQSFYLNPLLTNNVAWYDRHQLSSAAMDLVWDARICSLLGMQERLAAMYQAMHEVNCRVGRLFTHAIVRLTEEVSTNSADWKEALKDFATAIAGLKRQRFSTNDIHAAQGFVGCIGDSLRLAAACAKDSGSEAELASVVESQLIPAFEEAHINYESGHLAISDMLQSEGICGDAVQRLLGKVESWFSENTSFKSGDFIYLAARFARAGNQPAAERNLVSGVRAAFTYGYRKDTTINDFLVAFDLVAVHLGERFTETAEFVTRALVLLDSLTDGRMLYYASSYLIGLVCRFDVELAAKLAECLWTNCHSLRPVWIVQAAGDQGVEMSSYASVFAEHAPTVKLEPASTADEEGENEDEYDGREDFVISDTTFSASRSALRGELEERIERSRFSEGLHALPALIRALLELGDVDAALSVFDEFSRALRQLLAPYPLPEIA